MSHRAKLVLFFILTSCGDKRGFVSAQGSALGSPFSAIVAQQFAQGRWQDALNTCSAVLLAFPNDCDARYCELLGGTMKFVDQVNDYLLPKFRQPGNTGVWDLARLLIIDQQLAAMSTAADEVTTRGCSYDLPVLPLRIGDLQAPLVLGEVRGRHTPRDAHLLGAIAGSFRYLIANLFVPPPIPPLSGQSVPALPALLDKLRTDLLAHDALLFSTPTSPGLPNSPSSPTGGWWDKDQDGVPSRGDELLVDIFVPGSAQRVFDFSGVSFISAQNQPRGALVATAALPPARCGYQRWHVDTLLSGPDVGTADGMSFSPDGTQVVLPIKVNGVYQIHILSADGTNPVCLTCATATAASDGVRWRPGSVDTLLFVSNRDHPFALGGSAGGAGQDGKRKYNDSRTS